MKKQIDSMINKISWIMFLLTIMAILSFAYICNAANSNLRFSWDAVTENVGGGQCTDLAGYAIYRSRDADKWDELIGDKPAFAQVSATETFIAITCPESGIWYWLVRAFDTSANYSVPLSEIVMTNVDTISPGVVFHFRTCQAGDINCDGDINGADLVEFSEAFGK